MTSKYERRPIVWAVCKEGMTIFDEASFRVEVDDEAGGEFVVVKNTCEDGCLKIDPQDWPALRDAIELAISECRAFSDD